MKSFKTLLLAALLGWHAAALSHGNLLSLEPLDKIQRGVTTAAQVRELLGVPARHLRFPARNIEALEYNARSLVISITIGADGKVVDILRIQPSFP
jgi:hypothetical protein